MASSQGQKALQWTIDSKPMAVHFAREGADVHLKTEAEG
jgi:hypothetical protein